MQPVAVVHGFDKGSDGASGLAQVAIAASVDLFLLEGFHEAFGLGVVVRIADAAHARLDVIRRQDLLSIQYPTLYAFDRTVGHGAGNAIVWLWWHPDFSIGVVDAASAADNSDAEGVPR
jgi:hypothetical protein